MDVVYVYVQVLVQPLKSFSGKPRVWRKILFSWLLALIFAIPQLLIFVQTQDRRSLAGSTQDIIVHQSINVSVSFHDVYRAKCTFLAIPYCKMQDIIVYGCKSAGYTSEWQRKVYFTFMTSYILIIPTCNAGWVTS